MKRIIAACLLLCLLLGGCAAAPGAPDLLEPVVVNPEVEAAAMEEVFELNVLAGSLIPQAEPVYFPVDAAMGEVLVMVGQQVKKGDVLATLDEEGLNRQLEELKKQLETADSVAEMENNRLTLAAQLQESQRDALQAAGNDPVALELKEIDVWEAWQAVTQAREKQTLQQRGLREKIAVLEEQLGDNARILAPTDGIVSWLSSRAVRGEHITRSSVLMYVSDPSRMYIKTSRIPDRILENCDRIYARIGDREYDLTPLENSPQADLRASLNKQPLTTCLALEEGQKIENPGQVCNAMVVCRWKDAGKVLSVPSSAVYQEDGSAYVYCLQEGRKVKVNVKIDTVTRLRTQITDGLKEGDLVYVKD